MAISVFDLLTIGIGPSSSHTVGPMRAARLFVTDMAARGILPAVARVQVEMFGSLGSTGKGHGTDKAVMLGLEGETPEGVDTDTLPVRIDSMRRSLRLKLFQGHEIDFDPARDLIFHRGKTLPYHPNGLLFHADDASGGPVHERTYYSVGGGFVVNQDAASADRVVEDSTSLPRPFRSAAELLAHCAADGVSISALMMRNETTWRSEGGIRDGLLRIWGVMQDCVERGCHAEGILPGGLKVRRRAASFYRQLTTVNQPQDDRLGAMDWINLYALAVSEENAAGGRVVTAPTNGAAGIMPAVLHYARDFTADFSDDSVVRFLLTAAAVGILFKENASISGAEVGCQGEIGSASSMAAAGLTEILGGTPEQVENAAEIAMEHNLGLTCDPIGGLVQIPCIERNAMGAIKAINASRMALRGDGRHFVSLDKVIKTMRQTGADMKSKYKETARGGLAVNITEC